MSGYNVSRVMPSDKRSMEKIDLLLNKEGISRDKNLDYTCAAFDDDYNIVGTGSCFGNTLRCFAVSGEHQGEGILNSIISHLIQVQFERGNSHIFLYTKAGSAKFFADLGFYEIMGVDGVLSFMENRRMGFKNYLEKLSKYRKDGISGAIVMNANPFTLGHRYLVERAAQECDTLHVFVVSEDVSYVPFGIRKKLVAEGVADLSNVILHESGPYIISNATFPSYFLKDEAEVTENHARLDIAVFSEIGRVLGISRRYVGEEPFSESTGIYNRVMASHLPEKGIECVVVPRLEKNGIAISATRVRESIENLDLETLSTLVPPTTYAYYLKEGMV